MRVVFVEPDKKHSKSKNKSIGQVGMSLEQRYFLTQNFFRKNKQYFLEFISKNPNLLLLKQEIIKHKWRDYILKQEHGIQTKASLKRENKTSFFDTGDYMENLKVLLYPTDEERKLLLKLRQLRKK